MKRAWLGGLASLCFAGVLAAEDWPQWMGPNRDGRWAEKGVLSEFPKDGLKKKWSAAVGGGYAGPAVANGKVFVADFQSKDTFNNDPATASKMTGKERLVCFDEASGKQLWVYEYPVKYAVSYPAGPRCTPTIAGNKAYFLGAMGDLTCIDIATGQAIWKKDFKETYNAKTAIWGFCSHPLVDGDTLYCVAGGSGALVVALNKDTGAEVWKSLSPAKLDEPGYAPVSIIEAGGARQLIVWSADTLYGLNLKDGKPYWQVELVPNYGMAIMAPQKYEDFLFAGGIGGKSVVLKLDKNKPAVTEVYRGKADNSLYPVNMTPIIDKGTIFGVDQMGKLMAVELQTGKRLWETGVPIIGKDFDRKLNSGTAFLVKNQDHYYLFGENGHLVVAKLSPEKYEEISRFPAIQPTNTAFGRDVAWHHPAFANGCVYLRNDKEIVVYSLQAK